MKNKKILATTILGCSFFQICPNVISNLGIHQVLANEVDGKEDIKNEDDIKKPKNLMDFFENYEIKLSKYDKDIIDISLLKKHCFEDIFKFYNQKGISNDDMQKILCGYEKRPPLNNSEKEKITDIIVDCIGKIKKIDKNKHYRFESLIDISDYLTFCNNKIPVEKVKLNQLQNEFISKGFSYDTTPDPNLNYELQKKYEKEIQKLQEEGIKKYQELAKEQGKKSDLTPFLAKDVKINEDDYKYFSNIYNKIMNFLYKGKLPMNIAGFFIPIFKNNLNYNIIEKYSEKGDEIYDTIDIKPLKPGEKPKPLPFPKPGEPMPTTINEYNNFLLFRQHNDVCNELNKYIQEIAEKNNLNMVKFFVGDIDKGEAKLTKEEENKINEYINNLRILESVSDNKINVPVTTTMWRLSSLKGELIDNDNHKQPGRYETGIKFTSEPDESYKDFSDKFDKICGEKQNEIMKIFERNNIELEDILDGDLVVPYINMNDEDYKKLYEMKIKLQHIFDIYLALDVGKQPPFEYTKNDRDFMEKRGIKFLEVFGREIYSAISSCNYEFYDGNSLYHFASNVYLDRLNEIIQPKPDGSLEDTKPGKPEQDKPEPDDSGKDEQNKPSQEKPKPDESEQDKPGQNKPSQEKPKPDDSEQDKPSQDNPSQDNPKPDESEQEKPSHDKPSQEKPKPDDSEQDKPSQDNPSQEKPKPDDSEQDKPSQDESDKEKPESGQDKPEQQKPEDKPEQDKPNQQKPGQDDSEQQKPENKPGQDESDKDKPSQDKPKPDEFGKDKQDKPSQDNPSQDESDKEKPSQEKPSQNKLSSDKFDKEKHNQVEHDSKDKESNKSESKDSEKSDLKHSESNIIDDSLKDKLSNEAKNIIVQNKLGKDKQEIIAKVPEKQQAKVANLIKTAENNPNISNMLIVTFITGLSIAGFALFKKFKKE